jgi:L-iditol 2-dehydrogenase
MEDQKSVDDKTMLAAEYHSNTDIRLKELPIPEIDSNEILVKMSACGICGTDVMEWYRKKKGPRVLGHEMSGVVVEAGVNVSSVEVGDNVFVSHHVPCFECHYCNNNKFSACETLHKGNFDPGGFAEYIRVPSENVEFGTFKLPKNMSFEEASMIEPMACALAGQNLIKPKANETTLVIGSGISGLTHIQLLSNLGSNTIATDISEYRLNKASYFGSDHVFHVNNLNEDILRSINNGRLADNVIVCAGNKSAVQDAFKYVDKKGKILFFAIPSSDLPIPFEKLWRNEISIFFNYGAGTNDIEETIDLYTEKKLNFKDMVTHSLPLSRIAQGFKLVQDAKESIKVVVVPDES